MSEYAQSQGISVQNTCYHCALVSEYSPELRCLTCDEDKEGRDDAIAYDIVDEGNLQYGTHVPLRVDEPSAHDWVASTSRVKPFFSIYTLQVEDTREEFTPPIVQLVDGGTLDNLWELEDYTQRQRETQCKWCNILTPKMFADCQSCDKPLESNV
jgi:hypothetical protein